MLLRPQAFLDVALREGPWRQGNTLGAGAEALIVASFRRTLSGWLM